MADNVAKKPKIKLEHKIKPEPGVKKEEKENISWRHLPDMPQAPPPRPASQKRKASENHGESRSTLWSIPEYGGRPGALPLFPRPGKRRRYRAYGGPVRGFCVLCGGWDHKRSNCYEPMACLHDNMEVRLCDPGVLKALYLSGNHYNIRRVQNQSMVYRMNGTDVQIDNEARLYVYYDEYEDIYIATVLGTDIQVEV
ncbi:hypothetical protein N3K66_005482 [Trichothecium roseum]|uniref:Uncharacterized protein n=1 Tax=Trichothecium roseum TaxID=47278 RepID=A0ACC0UYG8_9HYPO|nr:hypothetical protein N3K66_005482 [Trichothecium roseum]